MRRTAAIYLLLASGGLLNACGGATHTASSQTRSTTASTSSSTKRTHAGATPGKADKSAPRVTDLEAQARAFASAVNLRASDVPGFHPAPKDEQHTAGERRVEKELLQCAGGVGGTAGAGTNPKLVASGSGTFQRQASIVSQSLSSEASVARTPALAARQLTAFRSGLLRKCLSHYVGGLLDSQRYHGAKISPVTTRQGSPPASGTTGSFGLRFTASLTLRSIQIPLYIDILGFVDGSAEVSLFATGIPEPVPAKIEEHLFSLLLARAKAHKT